MFLKLFGLIATMGAGFGLGRAPLRVHVRMAISAALLAAVLQTVVNRALPHAAIEQLAHENLHSASGQVVLFALATVETAGLLLPVLLVPWSSLSSRGWATLFVLGAAQLAGATYYFPFDVVIVNGEVLGPQHASYELDVLFSLPFGAVGYAMGWLKRRRDASRGPRHAIQS